MALLTLLIGALLAGPVLAAPADFPEPKELRRDVDFWLRVYTEITTEQGFLHDEQNLSVVYGQISIPNSLTGKARESLIDAARDVYVSQLRGLASKWRVAEALANQRALQVRYGLAPESPRVALGTLGFDPDLLASEVGAGRGAVGELVAALARRLPPNIELTASERRIYESFGDEATAARIAEAATRVRFQLGQADRFRAGIERSGVWESHIARTFAAQGLPPELAALPHVESSFNAAAYSKVGAAGLWQFMRSTGRLYMRIDDEVDERMDPFRATEAAAQLLAYNYRLLGSWPLAITAYNHGAAGMRRARDSMGTADIATIARYYRGSGFGFASRNFYPSFLAVLRIDRDPLKYFPGVRRLPPQASAEIELPAWVPVSAIEATVGVDRNTLRALNPALREAVWSGERYLPRGYRLHLPRAANGASWTLTRLLGSLPADQLYTGQVRTRNHVARQGDTLAKLARRYGMRAADLAALNGLARDASLKRGLVLRLPEIKPPLWQNPAATVSSAEPAAVAEVLVTTAPPTAPPPAVAAVDQPAPVDKPSAAALAPARPPNTLATPAPVASAGAPDDAPAGSDGTAATPAASLEPLDSSRYGVASDGTVRVLEGETLGQFADWLGIATQRLRDLNPGQANNVSLGSSLRLEFTAVSRSDFQQARERWHRDQQSAFFETQRIVGSENYTVRPGDTLWLLLDRFSGVPPWLLEQYNPNLNLFDLRAGTRLVVPKVAPP